MIENKLGKELHQRQFKGEKLSEEESETLENWYADQDELEAFSLNVKESKPSSFLSLQIKESVNQLTKLTQRIQQVLQENEKIRAENARLLSV